MERGANTLELLDAFYAELGENAVAILRDFTGVQSDTVRRWLTRENAPIGENLIMLRVMLSMAGYKPPEYEELLDRYKRLAMAISFNLLKVDDIARDFDLAQRHAVLRTMHGSRLLKQREYKLDELLETVQAGIEENVELWKSELDSIRKARAAAQATSTLQDDSEAHDANPSDGQPDEVHPAAQVPSSWLPSQVDTKDLIPESDSEVIDLPVLAAAEAARIAASLVDALYVTCSAISAEHHAAQLFKAVGLVAGPEKLDALRTALKLMD